MLFCQSYSTDVMGRGLGGGCLAQGTVYSTHVRKEAVTVSSAKLHLQTVIVQAIVKMIFSIEEFQWSCVLFGLFVLFCLIVGFLALLKQTS